MHDDTVFLFKCMVVAGILVLAAGGVKAQSLRALVFDSGEWKKSEYPLGLSIQMGPKSSDEGLIGRALQNAVTDLRGAILTTVYIAAYESSDQGFGTFDEFSIYDIEPDTITYFDLVGNDQLNIVRIFSAKTEPVLTPDCGPPAHQHAAALWETPLCWVVKGGAELNPYDPNISYQQSKIAALSALSRHVGVRIQSLNRSFDERMTTTKHLTQGYLFQSIGVKRLVVYTDSVTVYLEVPKAGIIGIHE